MPTAQYGEPVSQASIAAWLGEALGPCSDWQQKGQTWKCRAGDVPVTWLPKAVGKWNSLYLESDATPWEDDIACARAAFKALNVEVRCAPGSWVEEEGEEQALKRRIEHIFEKQPWICTKLAYSHKFCIQTKIEGRERQQHDAQ